MTKHIIRYQALFLLTCLTIHATAQPDKQTIAALNNYFTAFHQNQQFTGNVLVAENGKVIYEKSFGPTDFTSQKPLTRRNIFPIASITKSITATAILQQKQIGHLQITDPVQKYLPDFPYPEITIHHLLSHTSGLPPYNAFFDSLTAAHPDTVFTNADFIPGMLTNKKLLLYQPGEKYNYDNINYILLALILEKVSGMTYPDYLKKYILQPAGMKDTRSYPFAQVFDPNLQEKALVIPCWFQHIYSDQPVRINQVPFASHYWHTYQFQGFGDLIAPTHDLLQYDQALYTGKLLNDTELQKALTPVRLNNGKDNTDLYCLGWETEHDSLTGHVIYHSGDAVGLSCIMLRNISRHQTIIIFDNGHPNAHLMATAALNILNGLPVNTPKKILAASYAKILLHQGAGSARDALLQLKTDTINYTLSEEDMNLLGYDLMRESNYLRLPITRHLPEALATFKLNTELYPDSWNVYDSYGEALLKNGDKTNAATMYRKSIDLNPKNEDGKKILEQMQRETGK